MASKAVRVIIPCYRADATIRDCLESIFLSENIDMEVVIVDDGDTGNLAELAVAYPITVVKTAGKQGAGTARNCGAGGFSGTALVFVDADVKVERCALYNLINPIVSGIADAAVGRYSRNVSGRKTTDAYKQLYLAYTYSRPKKALRNTFWTALGAVRTDFFKKVGGFDTNYRGAGPEDLDLGIKLSAFGARIVSVPQAAAEHLASDGLIGLLANDLRKGCEDVYVHWMKGVSLTDNRHAGISSILAVLCAWIVLVSLFFPRCKDLHWGPFVAACLYLSIRCGMFARGYLPAGLRMLVTAIPIAFVLDLVRGIAVVVGTALAACAALTFGNWKPFSRIGKEMQK